MPVKLVMVIRARQYKPPTGVNASTEINPSSSLQPIAPSSPHGIISVDLFKQR